MEYTAAEKIAYMKKAGYKSKESIGGWIKRMEKEGSMVQNVISHEAVLMKFKDHDAFHVFIDSMEQHMHKQLDQIVAEKYSAEGEWPEAGEDDDG